MSLTNGELSAADIAAVTGNNNGGFGVEMELGGSLFSSYSCSTATGATMAVATVLELAVQFKEASINLLL